MTPPAALAAALARRNIHYGWVVGRRHFPHRCWSTAAAMGTPGVLIVPLEKEFGWDNAQISSALALRIMLFGLFGPFAAAFMNRFGVRRVIIVRHGADRGGLAGLTGDDAAVAARSAVGRRGRHRHRADRDGSGGDGGDALVQSPPRPGHRHAGGEQCDRSARLSAADRRTHHRFGWRAALIFVCRMLALVALVALAVDARPAERPRSAALWRDQDHAAAGRRRGPRLAC